MFITLLPSSISPRMVYTLIFRLSRTSYRVPHILHRVNVTLPPQTLAFRGCSRGLSGLGGGGGGVIQTRGFHVGLHFRSTGEDRGGKNRVSVPTSKPTSGVSAAQKVKEVGTDFTYLVVVLIGLGVTGGLLYVIFHELFSSSSPSKLYGKAFDKCRTHPEVIGAFGEPIKGYGETTRRGRRQQVSHIEYLKNDQKHMRLKFYIEGSEPGLHGTVHSESKQNPETGKYEFRYIFVDIDTYPRRTIVVEDNR